MSLLSVVLVCSFAPAPFVRPTCSYVGVEFGPGNDLRLASVFAASPAEKAGLQMADVLVSVDGKKVRGPDEFEALLRKKRPGHTLELAVRRANVEQTLRVRLGTRGTVPYLGVSLIMIEAGGGVGPATLTINVVADRSPASAAGLQVRDVVLHVDDAKFNNTNELAAFLRKKKPGDVVNVSLQRDNRTMQVKVKLGTRPGY